jgi:ABC-2 type transport system permease protein
VIVNRVGFATLVKREWQRTVKVINQVIWPPIITTVLYVFVFGLALGSRIKTVNGVSYGAFLIPGLIMLQVIDASYGECSSSLFQSRFLGSVAELLVAPMSAVELVYGFIVSGVLRAYVIAALIALVGGFLTHTVPASLPLAIVVIGLVGVLFSALGLIFGLMAEKFDHIAVLTTFVITPLTFVGGVFTSISFLPPIMRVVSYVNPIFYMIDALRFSFTLHSDVSIFLSLGVIVVLTAVATLAALRMFASGYKLRV